MIKIALPIFFLFLFSGHSPISASPADSILWTQQNKGYRTLWGVHFLDSLTGFAFGDYGTFYKTVNGGSSWVQASAGTSDTLTGMSFVNCSTGYLCTNSGRILKSIDTGRTWTQNYYRAGWLSDILFWNRDTGWAVGSARRVPYATYGPVIYKTRNGGSSWDSTSVSGPYSLAFVRTLNGRQVYTGGYNYLAASSNAGVTWSGSVSFSTLADAAFSSSNGYINTVAYQSATRGLAVGRYGHILRTENGGGSWATARANDFTWLEDVRYVDSSRAVIAGERGAVLSTGDGGVTWTKRYPRHSSSTWAPWFRALFCLDDQHLWMAGDSGLILKGRFFKPVSAMENRNPVGPESRFLGISTVGSILRIRFQLSHPGHVVLFVYDLAGRCVGLADQGFRGAGAGLAQWKPANRTAAGVYGLKITLDGRVAASGRILIIQ